MSVKKYLLFIIFGSLIILLLIGCGSLSRLVSNVDTDDAEEISEETSESGESESNETNQERSIYNSPDFTLESLTKESVTLSSLTGQIVVLNFWATWCPPCREELPDFQAAWEKYKDEGVVFLGISIDQNRSEVESFIKDSGITYTILLDLSSQVASQYGITAIPTTFILDVDGTVLFSQVGGMTEDQLSSQIEGALK